MAKTPCSSAELAQDLDSTCIKSLYISLYIGEFEFFLNVLVGCNSVCLFLLEERTTANDLALPVVITPLFVFRIASRIQQQFVFTILHECFATVKII